MLTSGEIRHVRKLPHLVRLTVSFAFALPLSPFRFSLMLFPFAFPFPLAVVCSRSMEISESESIFMDALCFEGAMFLRKINDSIQWILNQRLKFASPGVSYLRIFGGSNTGRLN